MKYLLVTSRSGKYNFCNPSEESISTAFRVFEDDKFIKGHSITTEYEENDGIFDPNDAADMIIDYYKHILFSTARQDGKDFAKFLRDNAEEIENGNRQYEIKKWEKRKEEAKNKLKELSVVDK